MRWRRRRKSWNSCHPSGRMNAAIIAIGSEMLGPTRVDTNSLKITAALEQYAVALVRKSIVGDKLADLVAEIRFSAAQADILVVTGGLGPTEDDLTREALAEAFGLAMHEIGRASCRERV